jgi:hypothetical protein
MPELPQCSPRFFGAVSRTARRRTAMTVSTLLLIIVILVLIGALPTWPYSRGWGYGPSGILGAILIILLILALLGRL